MARRLGPDENTRWVYLVDGDTVTGRATRAAVVYADEACTTLANIAVYDGTDTPGGAIAGSTLTVDSVSKLPLFWFPDGTPYGPTVLWVKVAGGPATRIDAQFDARIAAEIATAVTKTGGGKATSAAASVVGATTVTLTAGNVHVLTLTGNVTLTLAGATAGVACTVALYLKQDATGSRLVTWPASVKWPAGVAPTLSTGANKVDLVTLTTVDGGTTWWGSAGGLDFR